MHHLQFSAAGILAVAASVYGVLQAAKKAGLDGYISGRLGVIFAVVFAFISTIAIAGNLSANTICTANAVALAASGLHANVKVAAGGALSAPSPVPSAGTAGKLTCVLLATVAALSLTAFQCGSWDQAAYETLAVSKAVVDTAAADYQTGSIERTQATYEAISKAQAAQAAAVEALETYELAKAAASTAPDALQADFASAQATLANIGPLVGAIEALDPKAAAKDTRTTPASGH